MASHFFSFYRLFDYLGLRIDKLKVESGIFIEKSHFRSSKKSDGNELHFRRKLGYGGHPTGLPNTSVPVCPCRKGRKKPKRKRKCQKLDFRSRFRRPVRTGLRFEVLIVFGSHVSDLTTARPKSVSLSIKIQH